MSENYLNVFRNPDGSFISGDPRASSFNQSVTANTNSFVDLSKFPTKYEPNVDFRGWVNELLKVSNNDNINPLLLPTQKADGKYYNQDGSEYDPNFNYQQYLPPYESLTNIGDPRFNLATAMAAVTSTFVPRQILYLDIIRAGGCQIIANYVCDTDGNPIVTLQETCSPEILARTYDVVNTLKTPITLDSIEVKPAEVMEFIYTSFTKSIENDILAFKNYVDNNFIKLGYAIRLIEVENFPYFLFVELKKDISTVYLRYYYQDKNKVSAIFGLPVSIISQTDATGFLFTEAQKSIPLYNTASV
jgi:hypothetical protein